MKTFALTLGLALSFSAFASRNLYVYTTGLAIEDAQVLSAVTSSQWVPCENAEGELSQCVKPLSYKDVVRVTVRYDDSSSSEGYESTYTEDLGLENFAQEELSLLSLTKLSQRKSAAHKILKLDKRKDTVTTTETFCGLESDFLCQKPSDYITQTREADVLVIDIVRK